MTEQSKQPESPKEGRSSEDLRSQSSRNPNLFLGHLPSPSHAHRQSFSDQLRGPPPSPRSQRQSSISTSHASMQALLNDPPTAGAADTAFAGRDWREITVRELVNSEDLRWVEVDTGVETATSLLIESGAPAVLIRLTSSEKSAVGTFDYNDLNTYLLFAVGELKPNEENVDVVSGIAKKAQAGEKIALQDVKRLGSKEPFVTLPHTASLVKAVEVFGGGVHRIVVVKEGTTEVTGILSQLKLVKFLWENRLSFPIINQLYGQSIKDLGLGSQQMLISINGDSQLREGLKLMNNEGITSLAVVDNGHNVVGNISTVDVKLLTSSNSKPLLYNTCLHFISVILSTRGMNDGKDSFPVFHIGPYTTLAHTVAKLVATKSHRMWVVDAPSPLSSGPPTPGYQTAIFIPPQHAPAVPQPAAPFNSPVTVPSISTAALPGANMSGHLSGVVSLTDILNLFARVSGLHPNDPNETRRQRRSSSSHSGIRGSLDSARSSNVDLSRR